MEELKLLDRSIADLNALRSLLVEKKKSGSPYVTPSPLVVALDAGHGGINPEGEYTTYPAKMAEHPFGTVYEGVINRKVVDAIAFELELLGIDYHYLHHEYSDTALNKRTWKANQLYQKYKVEGRELLTLSIHFNAFRNPKAKGWEVYTSPGKTGSDPWAEQLYQLTKKTGLFTMRPDTSDGDHDKEARFWMLTRTLGPSILSENGFFTNPQEAWKMLHDPTWLREAVTMPHVQMIHAFNQSLKKAA
ncbi:MAG: N-acetylmuramoyl-L-alanine amidase [Bacteroidota bacterium]